MSLLFRIFRSNCPVAAAKQSTLNRRSFGMLFTRAFSSSPIPDPLVDNTKIGSRWEKKFGKTMQNFPDFIEKWSVQSFYRFGAGATVAAGLCVTTNPTAVTHWIPLALMGSYWYIGYHDINQEGHAVRRNFPVLGNVRYILESLRPEIRQYFVEGESEAVPFSRAQRSIVYQRAKRSNDTLPLGTRRDVYAEGYEWLNHSIWPTHLSEEQSRVLVGEANPYCTQPYSASILNVSGMSYGALSKAAILALSTGAKLGGFYHNTGEGGVSRYHLEGGGDLVWNIGTGYFGCRDRSTGKFCPDKFSKTAQQSQVKMIEIKLSQGAKPAHGGLLPGSKVTEAIAEARGVSVGEDCNSPPNHSAFTNAKELASFVGQLRELSGGKPVGFKICVGKPQEMASVVSAMIDAGDKGTPDFITIDGSEGGTGAAPPEFSNSVGTPLVEGLALTHQLLVGAGIRDKVKIICSGKVVSGFNIIRNMCLGADICNAARAMMFALGCIMSLKCQSNTCPTGIATQDERLMKGLVVDQKATRVYSYHRRTCKAALEMIGAAGVKNASELSPHHIMVRHSGTHVTSYAELFPDVAAGALLNGTAPEKLQQIWDTRHTV